jgi:polyisoprenoid-binding protein YceI
MRRLLLLSLVFVTAAIVAAPRVAIAVTPSMAVVSPIVAQTPAAAAPAPATTAPAPPTSMKRAWTIDTRRTSFVLQVFKEGLASSFAHDHVIHATKYDAALQADPTNPTTASIEVTVAAAALVNDDTTTRQQFNLPLNVSDGDRREVDEAMKGDEVLDVAKYPTISFRSTGVVAGADGHLTLKGKLTLHGVTRDVAMPFSARVDGDTIDTQARFAFRTSEFGMPPYKAMLGAVRCKDEVVLHLHVVAVAR